MPPDPKLRENADAGDYTPAEEEFDAAEGDEAELESAEGGEDDLARGEEDDDGGDAGDEVEQPLEDEPRRRKPRGIDPEVAAELARARADAAAANARADERNQADYRRQAAVDEQAERERLSLMTSDEKAEYHVQKASRQTDAKLNGVLFRLEDSNDRVSFDSYCARTPAAARLADTVEQRIGELRQRGQNVSRRVMLRQILGERAEKALERESGKLKKTAAVARERERGRPAAPPAGKRGDGVRRGGDEKTLRFRRLENQQL